MSPEQNEQPVEPKPQAQPGPEIRNQVKPASDAQPVQPAPPEPPADTQPMSPPTADEPVNEPVNEAADTTVEVPENPDWRIESWKGLPKLQCNYCGYSTMKGEEDMIEHVNGRHRAPSRVKGASGLVSPNGDVL